jgi:hypothetical protein
MVGGSTNPISMTGFVETVSNAVHNAKSHLENAHDLAKVKRQKEDEKLNGPCVDLTIKVCMVGSEKGMNVEPELSSVVCERFWHTQDGCHRLLRSLFCSQAR